MPTFESLILILRSHEWASACVYTSNPAAWRRPLRWCEAWKMLEELDPTCEMLHAAVEDLVGDFRPGEYLQTTHGVCAALLRLEEEGDYRATDELADLNVSETYFVSTFARALQRDRVDTK